MACGENRDDERATLITQTTGAHQGGRGWMLGSFGSA